MISIINSAFEKLNLTVFCIKKQQQQQKRNMNARYRQYLLGILKYTLISTDNV